MAVESRESINEKIWHSSLTTFDPHHSPTNEEKASVNRSQFQADTSGWFWKV